MARSLLRPRDRSYRSSPCPKPCATMRGRSGSKATLSSRTRMDRSAFVRSTAISTFRCAGGSRNRRPELNWTSLRGIPRDKPMSAPPHRPPLPHKRLRPPQHRRRKLKRSNHKNQQRKAPSGPRHHRRTRPHKTRRHKRPIPTLSRSQGRKRRHKPRPRNKPRRRTLCPNKPLLRRYPLCLQDRASSFFLSWIATWPDNTPPPSSQTRQPRRRD